MAILGSELHRKDQRIKSSSFGMSLSVSPAGAGLLKGILDSVASSATPLADYAGTHVQRSMPCP